MKIIILTGGPSLERGISLNSARSILDHLGKKEIEIIPIYFDQKKRPYQITPAELYANTPADFDFKIAQGLPLTQKSLVKVLRSADIVFPAMHGPFGEDGQIQAFLEKNAIPFIGSGSRACKIAFDKYNANKTIQQNGFYTLPSALLKIYSKNNKKIIENFFKENKTRSAIIKPSSGGSSIGVFQIHSPEEALEKTNIIFSKRMDTRVVLEPYAIGKEFTVIILQNKIGLPVALMATEIEPYKEGQLFDFRKKYLPTNQVKYHYPARFDIHTTEKILTEAEQIFTLFGMKDFARFDGWVLDNGQVWFSDFNPISGMEQNSFLFQQTSRIGMSHNETLRFILKNSCRRQNIEIPEEYTTRSNSEKNKKTLAVLFGGSNSERQVSLMSGTNVWLKLCKSEIYKPVPYLLDTRDNIWSLPYSFILNHTVEEIQENIKLAPGNLNKIQDLEKLAKIKLMLENNEAIEAFFLPRKVTLHELLKKHEFIFLGLHGGRGEDGTMQKLLSDSGIKFNGSGERASRLCMNKFETGEFIRKMDIPGVTIATQKQVSIAEIKALDTELFWKNLRKYLNAKTIIAKPVGDGCSTGVVHLYNERDLKKYLTFVKNKSQFIPPFSITRQDQIVEMPTEYVHEILFEKFIETDITTVTGNKIKYLRRSGLVEVTIGLIEISGKMHAMNPSITIAEGEVLSLEEKFQGGTGVNLTPPPQKIVKPQVLQKAKKLAEILAEKIGLEGYARIDCFMNVTNGNIMIIEVNTLPGLTPSTVIFHQALAERDPIFPTKFLELLIKNKGY